MKTRLFDSLFGRLALLVVGVLLLSHFAWYALLRVEHNELETHYAVEETVFLVDAVSQHLARYPDQALPSRVKIIEPGGTPPANPSVSPLMARFVADFRDQMPPGTQVRVDEAVKPPRLWVMRVGDSRWIGLPLQARHGIRPLDRTLLWLGLILLSAVLSALFAAWQLQRPLSTLAAAVSRFGRGLPVSPVAGTGPSELRQLTRGFNEMVKDFGEAQRDRAVMLAGIAHDLKTPLARLRLRAEMVEEARLRDGVVRDVDVLSHIVDQFLIFANDGPDPSMQVVVDAQCERFVRSFHAIDGPGDEVQLDLHAGPDFLLPAATLDRILSNLLENAHTYGKAPITVATERAGTDGWRLCIADSGAGIAPQDLSSAARPFVRLDPARGGAGHSGLGLAIVERLVRRAGGTCTIDNRRDGGLRVSCTFTAAALAESAGYPQPHGTRQPLAHG